MARIENLIKDIADPHLRCQIAEEMGKLKARMKFGLVFEQHLPEVVQLPGLAVRPGARVAKRRDKVAGFFIVTAAINKKDVSIVAERGGLEEIIPKDNLVVVKRFGEPMYPALIPVDRVTRAPGKPYHTVINAENFHALQLLLYCYEGQVDVIYIDPPYNTGARDWKYNNDYVDGNDSWRHSKWLSFMEKRLLLARKLLKPDGVLIVTIDEHEVQNLGVLLRQVLPSARIQMITIVTNTAGSMSPGLFSRAEEYAYFCFFGTSKPCPMETDLLAESKPTTQYWFPLFRSRGLNDRPSKRPNLVYPVAIDPDTLRITATGRSLKDRRDAGEMTGDLDDWKPRRTEKISGMPVVWPILDTGEMTTWQIMGPTLLKLAKEGFLRVRRSKNPDGHRGFTISYVKSGNRKKVAAGEVKVLGREPGGALILEGGTRTTIPKSTWKVAAHDARLYGTTMLRNLLGVSSFTYPKSPYAVSDSLQTVLGNNRNGIVLDFFAGSGTTLQAVAMLNAMDSGSRRVILVTNNEVDEKTAKALAARGIEEGTAKWEREGIAESVTWPRVRYSLEGKRADGTPIPGEYLDGRAISEGFEENAQYLKLDFLDPNEVKRGDTYEAILPILWLMAGASGDLELLKGSGKHHFPKDCPFCILLREDHFKEFAAKLAERPDITHVFLVTDSIEAFHEMGGQVGKGKRCVQLYKSYLDNFKINLEPRNAD